MKKKYLIKGAFALVFGAFVASCSDYDNDYTSIADAKQATFAENFVKFYGTIDPNQDWGFDTPAASRITRTINSGWNGWAAAPSRSEFKTGIPDEILYITRYKEDNNSNSFHNYYLGSSSNVQNVDLYNGNYALYISGIKKISFTNPANSANHMYFYVLPGADLTITTYFNINSGDDFKMYVADGAKVTFEAGLSSCMKLYNRGEVVVKGENTSGIYSNGVIYNQGTMKFEGTGQIWDNGLKPQAGNISSSLYLANENSQFINEGTLYSKGLYVAGSAHFKNVSGGEVNVSGYTIVNSNQLSWINDGVYNTGYFSYTAGSTDVINNCRLNVAELFYMNLGDTDVNSFQMDGGSSVVCKNYFGDAPGFIKMGSKSLFRVKETATMNHTKADYGIYCVGEDYAVFQAKDIVATNIEQAYEVTYGGKLYVVADTHFDSPNYDSKSGQYPIIDFKNGFTKSNIYLNGSTPDIKIPASVCNPGFPDGYTDDGSLDIIDAGNSSSSNIQQWEIKKVINHKRVFCEDLGSSSNRKDYDYNDVVFDAKIIESYFVDKTYDGNTLSSTSSAYGTNYYAEITVLAAGGELSLTVAGEEANGLFGKSTSMIINTVSEADMETFVASHNMTPLTPVTFKYPFNSYQEATIKNIPVMVKSDNVPIYLKADKGEAPQKICVPVGTRWPYERVAIDEAYGNFTNWVGHTESFTPETLWGTNFNEDKLYPSMGATEDETGTETETFVKYKSNSSSYTFTPSYYETIVYDESESEGQNLSATPIVIDGGFFSSSNKGTVVRLYGVDNGNAQVTVMAGDVALGNTTRGDGKAYIYTLSTSQAASAKANGLSITGSDFTLYYVTIDDSDIDRTVEVEPTFSSNEITGSAIMLNPTTLSATGINISNSNFVNAGAGTEVYVYGTGDETSVSVSVNGSNLSKANSRQTRGTTYVTKAKKSVKFTMTAEQAAAAQTNGIKIAGTNFVLHAVGVVIAAPTPTPTPTPSDEQSVVWSSNASWNNGHHHFGTALTGVQKDKAATIVVSGHRGTWSWGVEILYDWTSIINTTQDNQYSSYGHWEKALSEECDGYVSIPLTAADVNNILANGLRIYVQNITTSLIEIKQ